MKIKIIQYKWAGEWGPFKIRISCGECSVTEGIIKDVINKEFDDQAIEFGVLPWLDNWWKLIGKGGWHAPIVTINGKLISQGKVLDRGLLAYYIRQELVKGYRPKGNIMFSKPGCPYCKKAKMIMKKEGIAFEDKNIIEDPLAALQLFYLTKQFFPKNKPVTVPQIWLDGKYFGDSGALMKKFSSNAR